MSIEIFRGNSTGLIRVKAGNFLFSGAGWSATLNILTDNGGPTPVPAKLMIKDPTDKYFMTQLLPEETELLIPGKYKIAVLVENSVTKFKQDAYELLFVEKSYIT